MKNSSRVHKRRKPLWGTWSDKLFPQGHIDFDSLYESAGMLHTNECQMIWSIQSTIDYECVIKVPQMSHVIDEINFAPVQFAQKESCSLQIRNYQKRFASKIPSVKANKVYADKLQLVDVRQTRCLGQQQICAGSVHHRVHTIPPMTSLPQRHLPGLFLAGMDVNTRVVREG